ncbi:MAG: 5'-nucleotidase, lipoprotein e(P4) family [Bacteroidales bacterium]|nr:5'-nucleotidase, lipoprotein e(P4) family [Bacteroidales bacterium]
MKKLIYFFVLVSFLGIGCKNKCEHKVDVNSNEHLTMAILFQQRAAEYKALCYQAFNVASIMLDNDLAIDTITKPRALVFDIDETLLDNSPYEAKCVLDSISYPEQWSEWCQLAAAKAIPGAVEFVNAALNKGYSIFYVSNRKAEFFEATKQNMLSEGFPLPSDEFLLMRTDENSKEARRISIEEKYHISMLVGDNLADFCTVFDNADLSERNAQTDNLKHKFGTKYIVLPNAMYGDWEMAVFDNNKDLSNEDKGKIRRDSLIGF